jgi:dolichol kinase
MLATVLFETVKCFVLLALHFAVLAVSVILINKKVGLPKELYRKLLHLVSVFSIMPIVIPSSSWIASMLTCFIFMGLTFMGAKKTNLEDRVGMKQRSSGEQQRSMLLLYGTYATVILFAWGVFGQKWAVVLSVIAWGLGDCVAALVGKRFGKHKVSGRFIEGKKSIEGTLGMFLTTFVSVFLLYSRHSALANPWFVVLVCFWIAVFSSVTELFTKNGLDTVACPLVSMIGFMILTLAAGGI